MYPPEFGEFIIQQLDCSSKLAKLESTPERSKVEIDNVEADIKAALSSKLAEDEAESDLVLREDLQTPISDLHLWNYRYQDDDYSEKLEDFPVVFPSRRWVM